jgi:hypothetical protein
MLGMGKSLESGSLRVQRTTDTGWTEVDLQRPSMPVVSGSAEQVETIVDGAQKVWPK